MTEQRPSNRVVIYHLAQGYGGGHMRPNPNGDWVSRDDYDQLRQDLARTESARVAILAENTHYKQRVAELEGETATIHAAFDQASCRVYELEQRVAELQSTWDSIFGERDPENAAQWVADLLWNQKRSDEPPAVHEINSLSSMTILRICTAYESGYGRGQSKRDLAQPYAAGCPEATAYYEGWVSGVRGASQPPPARNLGRDAWPDTPDAEWLRKLACDLFSDHHRQHDTHNRLLRIAERIAQPPLEPPVLGAGCGVSPMPTVVDAIEAHVRQIEQLCDAANLDPTEWLMPDLDALDGDDIPAASPLTKSERVSCCTCGQDTLGVVHRVDGPCYLAEAIYADHECVGIRPAAETSGEQS